MAEALGVAGSAVGIVSLGLQVCQGVLNYYGDWKDRDDDILRMYNATDDLGRSFWFLKAMLNSMTHGLPVDVINNVERNIASCEGGIVRLEIKLGKLRRHGGMKLQDKLHDKTLKAFYPFQAKSLAKLSTIVSELRDNLGFALSTLQTHLSLNLLFESKKIVGGIDEMRSEFDENARFMFTSKTVQDLEATEQARKETVDWISQMKFEAKQYEVLSARQEGTGEWFLKNPDFQAWLDGKDMRPVIWCPGIPGAGKTVLAAMIISYLQSNLQSSQVGVAYIYCDYRLQREQTFETLIASLLSQLVDQRLTIPDAVQKAHNLHRNRKTRPKLPEYLALLHDVISQFSTVFVVIDALDECDEGVRDWLLKEIGHFKGNARVVCTSRYLPDIMEAFEGVRPWLEISASESDMKKYIAGRVEQEIRLRRHIQAEPALLQEIEDKIIKLSQGMFLAGKLHLDVLVKKQTRKAVRTALQDLPKGINEIYDSIMSRIDAQEEEDTQLAIRALTWTACTFRPLTIFELQHATQIQILDPGDEDLGEDDIPSPDLILAVCAGLIIRDERGIVRLVHPSTQEYFDRRRSSIFPMAHHEITIACMRCLSLKAIAKKFSTVFLTAITMSVDHAHSGTVGLLQQYPLLFYASTEWRNHARKHIKETPSSEIDGDYWETLLEQLNEAGIMSYAANFGQNCIDIMLLVKFDESSKKVMSQPWTALCWSSYNGCLKTTECHMSKKFLTEKKNADTPLLESSKPSSLQLAGAMKDIAALNSQGVWTLAGEWRLIPSLLNGTNATQVPLIRRLLFHGAELKPRSEEETINLWQAAADNGRTDVAEILLSSGFQPDAEDYRGHTPLFRAASCGQTDMIKMLVSNGADINALDRSSRTVLFQAALFGHEVIVDSLIAHGAKVDARDREGCTVLCFISKSETRHPDLDVVKCLLLHEADANAVDNNGNCPLDYAARASELGLVEMLIANGAIFNSMTIPSGPTALACAVTRGKIRLAKRLIAKGVRDKDRLFGCSAPLLEAVINGDRGRVEQLLVDTLKPDLVYLEFALILRHQSVIGKLLLRRNFEINSAFFNGAEFLTWAVMLGEKSLVELLLMNGATTNSKTEDELTPLMLAIVTGQRSIVKALVAHGADVHEARCEDRFPLDCMLGSIDVNREDLVSKWSEEAYKIRRLLASQADETSLGNTP